MIRSLRRLATMMRSRIWWTYGAEFGVVILAEDPYTNESVCL